MSILTPHSKSGIIGRFIKDCAMETKPKKSDDQVVAYTKTGRPLTAKYMKRLLEYREATEAIWGTRKIRT